MNLITNTWMSTAAVSKMAELVNKFNMAPRHNVSHLFIRYATVQLRQLPHMKLPILTSWLLKK